MAPTLYYTIASPPVRSVLMTAKAIGLNLDLKPINLFAGEHLSEEFLKINPQHTVPTLVDGDLIIWDSHAINTYLIGKYAKDDSLYPKDLAKRAKIDQRLYFDSGVMFPSIARIAIKIMKEGASEIQETDKTNVMNVYNFLETFLESDLYLFENTMTVADLSAIPIITTMIEIIPIEASKYPKLTSYIKKMSELPYYEETNMKGVHILVKFINEKLEENKNKN